MTKDEVIRILKIERECISRNCPSVVADRDCSQCDLVQDQDYLLQIYNTAIKLLMEYDNGSSNV